MRIGKLNVATIVTSIIGISVCAVLSVLFYRQGRTLPEILAIVGSVASLFGLLIAIMQILAVKKVADATHAAVNETRARLVSRISLADVAKATRIVEQIMTHLMNKKLELAHLRLQDLREMLMQFRAGSFLNGETTAQYDQLLTNVGIHSENLFSAIYKDKSIDVRVINHTLQCIVEILVKAENELTYRGE
jgi:hypothetical protein